MFASLLAFVIFERGPAAWLFAPAALIPLSSRSQPAVCADADTKLEMVRALVAVHGRVLGAADKNNHNLRETNKRMLEAVKKEVGSLLPLVPSHNCAQPALKPMRSELVDALAAPAGADDEIRHEKPAPRGGGGGGGGRFHRGGGGGGEHGGHGGYVGHGGGGGGYMAPYPTYPQYVPFPVPPPPQPPLLPSVAPAMPQPSVPPMAMAQPYPAASNGGAVVCNVCSKRGHTVNECWTAFPHLRPRRGAAAAAPASN